VIKSPARLAAAAGGAVVEAGSGDVGGAEVAAGEEQVVSGGAERPGQVSSFAGRAGLVLAMRADLPAQDGFAERVEPGGEQPHGLLHGDGKVPDVAGAGES
jgi:hypothetical protein